MYHIHGKNWEARESADYKMLTRGSQGVSDLEVLSALIDKEEAAKALFMRYGSITRISQTSVSELVKVKGITQKRALQVVSAFELVRRKEQERDEKVRFTDAQAVANYLIPRYAHEQREIFTVLFINRNNELIAEEALFKGGVSAVIVDTKLIMKRAVDYLCSAILVAHNHPSGNLRPSQADLKITRQIKEASQWLDIQLLDHMIISYQGHYSFANEGML